jgi:protein-L-isoaspartate(D-aspartate) O-methyltransferase
MPADNTEKRFEDQRNEMVETQLIPRGISGRNVLQAMSKVPRHLFVPPDERKYAYEDCALPIGEGQTISQPYMVAVMTELLGLVGGEKVLEIGTGSGYQAAVLSELAAEVHSIERIRPLAERAEKLLKSLGYKNVSVKIDDGGGGLPEEAPFDGIIVTAGCPSIPKPLIDQLADGGRLVIPVGNRFQQVLTVATKEGETIKIQEKLGCVFVPLVGRHGWGAGP